MRIDASPSGVSSVAGLIEWLRRVTTSIAAGWNVEHGSDGTHTWGWTRIPYAATAFTADTSTWTVDAADVHQYGYNLLGDRMEVTFRVVQSDVGAGNAVLRVALPSGYRAAQYAFAALSYTDAGTGGTGIATVEPNQRAVNLYTNTRANWTNTTADNTAAQATIAFRVTKD